MNKSLLKNKIIGGNKFTFNNNIVNDNNISFTAKKNENNNIVNLTFFLKNNNEDDALTLNTSNIDTNINLKIITSNIITANYYEPNPNIEDGKKQNLVDVMNKFDTCLIVDFTNTNICYIFLNVNTSGNKSIKDFEDNHKKLNLKRLDTLMIIRFKQLGLDINFVNKFMAAVKGYVDKSKVDEKKRKAAEEDTPLSTEEDNKGGGKKMNNYKILNNLILKLNKINNVKKLTKPKAVKPAKPTKPKPVKLTKPKAVKPTKPTKPKATKPTKPKATKPTKPKATKPKPTKPKVTKPKATKKI